MARMPPELRPSIGPRDGRASRTAPSTRLASRAEPRSTAGPRPRYAISQPLRHMPPPHEPDRPQDGNDLQQYGHPAAASVGLPSLPASVPDDSERRRSPWRSDDTPRTSTGRRTAASRPRRSQGWITPSRLHRAPVSTGDGHGPHSHGRSLRRVLRDPTTPVSDVVRNAENGDRAVLVLLPLPATLRRRSGSAHRGRDLGPARGQGRTHCIR